MVNVAAGYAHLCTCLGNRAWPNGEGMSKGSAPKEASDISLDPLVNLDPAHLDRAQIWLVLVLLLSALGAGLVGGMRFITAVFLREQDLLVAGIVIAAGFFAAWKNGALARFWPRVALASPLSYWWIAGAVVALAGIGQALVFSGYPLSLDEFWARADGAILERGVPMARIPEEWREYAGALQPVFSRLLPDEGLWVSTYLPLNAVLQWLGGPLASPIMAAASILLVASVARTLLPDQPWAPLVAAVVLATSSQLLVTAMTPYAMTAHLLFNTLWLWLFVQNRAWALVLSVPVAALAMGLHQPAFFPLFALPFLLERFLAGQRIASTLYVAVIGGLFLAWSNYDLFAYGWFEAQPEGEASSGSGWLLGKLIERLSRGGIASVALMAANLLRFVLWQNPIVLPLVVIAAGPIVRLANGAPRELRAMLLGLVGTAVFMALVIPFQGHGWGYRYLHGLLGSCALIAAFAFGRLMQGAHADRWKGALVGATLLAIALFPLRAYQAYSFAAPYVAADRAIAEWQEQVVIVDAPRHAYAVDLVRNDPWLASGGKRLVATKLSQAQFERLCKTYSLRIFTDDDAARFGLREWPGALQGEPVFAKGCP